MGKNFPRAGREGRQRKRWEYNIREWTGQEFAKSQRAVENRGKKWKKLVTKSSMVPQRLSRLRDRGDDEMREEGWRVQCLPEPNELDTRNGWVTIHTEQAGRHYHEVSSSHYLSATTLLARDTSRMASRRPEGEADQGLCRGRNPGPGLL